MASLSRIGMSVGGFFWSTFVATEGGEPGPCDHGADDVPDRLALLLVGIFQSAAREGLQRLKGCSYWLTTPTEKAVDLPCRVPFEAPDDLFLG